MVFIFCFAKDPLIHLPHDLIRNAAAVVLDLNLYKIMIPLHLHLQAAGPVHTLKSVQDGILYKRLQQQLMDGQIHQLRRHVDMTVESIFQPGLL